MDGETHVPSETLSRSSPEPLYRQLADRLRSAIRGGRLRPGERLDSEADLAVHFAVSRITVRQALEELAGDELIVRRQGKGTFVTTPPVKHDLRRLHGLLASLFSQAAAASTRLLRYELCVPPPEARSALDLRGAQAALALERLYLIGGQPVALARDWLVPEVGALPRAKAELVSTEDLMRHAGIRIASTQVSLRAEAAGAAVGRLLKIAARAPVLVLRRKAIGDDGAVKEAGCIWFCSQSYEFVCATHGPEQADGLFHIQTIGADRASA